MDFKEADKGIAPLAKGPVIPTNNAERLLEGAKHLSPHLGKRMAKTIISGKDDFVRELMPQDLKLDIERLDMQEATKVSAYLGAVVGRHIAVK